jgi:phenylacetic acid degradation operon negative regulatory protein
VAPLAPSIKPQSVMLAFLGAYVLDNGIAVYSGSIVDVLERVGVHEQATRSTLSRMANRGLLARHRRGRRVYLGLTDRSTEILRDGQERALRQPVDRPWDGRWTLFGFSLPDDWRRQRRDLRARLSWAGFGRLQSGLWIAPSHVDVDELLRDLALHEHVIVFSARPSPPTDIDELIRDAYDLDAIAQAYHAFIDRWERLGRRAGGDALGAHLLLQAEWLALMRMDPRLPLRHLPPDWPATRAEALFHRLLDEGAPAAARLADAILDVVLAAPPPAPRGGQATAAR